MSKLRVLYILHHFPQISETYVRSEIEAVSDQCDVRVIALHEADSPYRNHAPYVVTNDPEQIREIIEQFSPHVLHAHWLQQLPTLAYFAGRAAGRGGGREIPFTVRAHSFDTLSADNEHIRRTREIINSDLCLGVLTFPFTRRLFEEAGVRSEKIRDCWPVVNYRRFHDRSPNGDAVMNVGACLPKKRMEDFLELATRMPGTEFNLYAMGYHVDRMRAMNERYGAPVNIIPPVEPEAMPAEFKKHRWLVYTADYGHNTVGWPLSIAEAQAAGVGVCVPNLRPDLRDYVGPAGFLYNSVGEVADIISRPFPEELREIGFEHARRSDVNEHKSVLTSLWEAAGRAEAGHRRPPALPRAGGDWGPGGTDWGWQERIPVFRREVQALVSRDRPVIMVDESQLGGQPLGRQTIPFPEREGQYWGPPADDESAIDELERLRAAGAGFIVFAWPAFWWLDHYAGFHRHLRSNFVCLLENDRAVVFKLG